MSHFDFVDKSLLIQEIIDDDKVILINRPRRFGKTFNLSMLQYFFAQEVDGNPTQALFDNLKIKKADKKYWQHQGKYPVISFSFKEAKSDNFSDTYSMMAKITQDFYSDHSYLLESEKLSEREKNVYRTILEQQATHVNLMSSLKDLTKYLNKYHGEKAVVLIDEYDTPIQSAYLHDYYPKIIEFFRGFFGAALKDNPYLYKAVLTGILRVSRESLFSGLNNIVIYSMLNSNYSEYFGFTEAEVTTLLKEAKLEHHADEVKHWYNGYQIGSDILYNPWSIANYIKERQFKPYWVNTSDNALVKHLLIRSTIAFKNKFEILLNGKSVEKILNENFVFSDLTSENESTIWNLLFMAGYLKVNKWKQTAKGPECQLAIPNAEIRNLYLVIIEEWLSSERGTKWYDEFLNHLLTGDMPRFIKDLEYIMEQTISVHDTAKDPEAFYHGLVVGLTASLYEDGNYELRSNRESGDGRYDYFIISKDPERLSILMEFKRARFGNLNRSAKAALAQIDNNNYLAEAKQRGINKLLNIGIAFSGKKLAIQHRRI